MQIIVINVNQRELGQQIITVQITMPNGEKKVKTFFFPWEEWVDIAKFCKELKKTGGYYP
jgi:hypothetical protein